MIGKIKDAVEENPERRQTTVPKETSRNAERRNRTRSYALEIVQEATLMQETNIDPHSAADAEEMQKLQGTWMQTECEVDGIRNPPEDFGDRPRATLTGNKFKVARVDGSIAIEGTFAIDATREPKAIDWTDTFGADAGKTFPAIYMVEGDRLIFCAGDEGQARPTEFRTRKGQVLRIHQRATP